MKMLMFDFRDTEKEFFEHNELVDFDISFIDEPLNEDYKLNEQQINETDIISVFRSSNLTDKVLEKFKNLRIIATRSYGYGHIDLDYCIAHNIAVLNVEQYGEEAVAQYAIALIIVLLRNMLPAIMDMKDHKINYKNYEGRTLNNLTLGIIGCGEIGSAVARIANFLGMNVIIHSYMQNPELGGFCNFVSLDELLENSDVISLHLVYTGDNYHLIGVKEFEKMKNGVYFVNTARGELLDIKALYDNLVNGKVKAAALDVLECEFLSTHPGALTNVIKDSESHCVETALVTQKLFQMDNVIITPHIAYNTREAINRILTTTYSNIEAFGRGVVQNKVC